MNTNKRLPRAEPHGKSNLGMHSEYFERFTWGKLGRDRLQAALRYDAAALVYPFSLLPFSLYGFLTPLIQALNGRTAPAYYMCL